MLDNVTHDVRHCSATSSTDAHSVWPTYTSSAMGSLAVRWDYCRSFSSSVSCGLTFDCVSKKCPRQNRSRASPPCRASQSASTRRILPDGPLCCSPRRTHRDSDSGRVGRRFRSRAVGCTSGARGQAQRFRMSRHGPCSRTTRTASSPLRKPASKKAGE
jgi:hypothetical protein